MANPGDEIYILVDGQPVLTVIDGSGVQRFPESDILRYLVESGVVSFNDLAVAFYHGQFDADSYQQFYMDVGYSVSGFEEIFGRGSSFEDNGHEPVEIINPLWLEDDDPAS